jgi:hypothetical protein
MSTEVVLVHSSGGLLAPALIADLRRERSSDRLASPAGFALPDHPTPTAKEHAADIELALETLATRWDNVKADLAEMETGRLRERWQVFLLRELGFEPQFQRSGLVGGDERFGVTHLGSGTGQAAPILLATGTLDAPPVRGRAPHDELQAYLNASERHRWGIAMSPTRLRIVRDFHHRRTRGYVEWDLDAIFEARSYPDFLALYRLAHASRFIPDDEGLQPLERIHQRSLDAGVAIGRKLQPQVKRALETIANGVATPVLREELGDPARARAFHRELLVFLYRVLFLLFAERRGLLPNSGVYAESYAVSRLRDLAAAGEHVVEPRRGDLWEGLKITFEALAGDGAEAIGAFPFDGPLFDSARTPTLSSARCENRTLLRAFDALTTVEIERIRQHVNYGDLGVEEIGSVYESLLDFLPVVSGGRIALEPVSEERSDLGTYYTPPELVDLVLSKSLDRVIEARLAAAGDDPADRELALLDITVIDPACGSAAFLIAAVDRLALALAGVRGGGRPDEHDLRIARRDVLQHCIYAVDKDETAVELAKVALWIHCAVEEHPLTFLDHRIQHGDSLVGWPLLGPLPRTIPDDAYEPTDKRHDRAERRAWRDLNRERQHELGATPPSAPDWSVVPPDLEAPEDSPGDVRRKADAYRHWRASNSVRRLERAANLWTAAFLWTTEAGAAPTSHEYWRALAGEHVTQTEHAERLAAELPFFHWALRFPEIRARGGFDCVIGNPPWEQFKPDQKAWFASRAPKVAALPGARREAAIKALANENPQLHDAWRRHVATIARLSEWARRCGRFTPSGAEANTYLLFAEHNADMLFPEGRAGVLVKSAFALDRSASALFQGLVNRGRLVALHDMVNQARGSSPIFPTVAAVERFSVVAFTGAGAAEDGFSATVMNGSVEEAGTRMPRRFTTDTLRTLNPRTRTLTSFRRNEELEVALGVHRRVPMLDFGAGENPWDVEYCTLFHSKGDSGKFLRREDLERDGWSLGRDEIMRRGQEVAVPLYEGQLLNRYDHRAKTYAGYAGSNKYGRKPNIPRTTDSQKADPAFEMEPRYWMDVGTLRARLQARVGERAMLAFRDVGAPWTNQRSAKGAVIPPRPATHKVPILVIAPDRAFEFTGVFNSTVFDFLVRGHMPGGSVALVWMLAQIPAPPPGLDPRIADNARKLSLTSYSVAEVFGAEPHHWDAEERYRLDVETDALVALAYGLDAESYAVVLDSFEVLQRDQSKRFGYYKLRMDCLAAFDALAASGDASAVLAGVAAPAAAGDEDEEA